MAPFKSWRRLIKKNAQMMNYSKINSCKKLFLFFIPGLLQEKSVDQ